LRYYLLDIICCPVCRHSPLELTELEESTASLLPTWRVETGYLYCSACGRFYFIIEGIPRLISEDFSELVDLEFARERSAAFAPHQEAFATFLGRLGKQEGRSANAQWEIEDVSFWESQVYSDERSQGEYMKRVQRSRLDAGNRTYPREKYLFRHLRPYLSGRILLDIGCGFAQTIRVLCDPHVVGYNYVGADLSLSALKVNRRTMVGDFVQCSADQLPFRDDCAHAVVLLGTLHHLTNQENTLRRLLGLLRPGGMIALHEVARRARLADRLPGLRRHKLQESAHNDSVDSRLVLRVLSEQSRIISFKREYSLIRALLSRWLAEPMRSRPWLTRAVLWLDDCFLATVGRLSPVMGGRAILVLARKLPSSATPKSS